MARQKGIDSQRAVIISMAEAYIKMAEFFGNAVLALPVIVMAIIAEVEVKRFRCVCAEFNGCQATVHTLSIYYKSLAPCLHKFMHRCQQIRDKGAKMGGKGRSSQGIGVGLAYINCRRF